MLIDTEERSVQTRVVSRHRRESKRGKSKLSEKLGGDSIALRVRGRVGFRGRYGLQLNSGTERVSQCKRFFEAEGGRPQQN